MPPHDDNIRVGHMLDAAVTVAGWLERKQRHEFDVDLQLQSAIAYQLQIIGEAAHRLPREFRNLHTDVPWRKITAMRHILVHDYYRVDVRIVWETATVHLPELARMLREILGESAGCDHDGPAAAS